MSINMEKRVELFNGPASAKKTYSVDEVSRILECSRQLVYKLIKSECFKTIRIEKQYRIIKSSFDEWLDNE